MVINPELVKKRKKPLKNVLNILSNEKRELKDYDTAAVEMLNQ
ncbi:MAG: hypothetical protein PHS92_01490 [Candidatus Gracilibacteria bacterium]|nr:hypothetical protein [Candidatus Gracilibacteria bacterium]